MATRRREASPEDPFEAIGCDDVVPIGSGGSSLVYRARQRAFDRLIALKVLSMPLADERSRRRFERELALAGRLTGHPNVVTVFASGFFADGRAYVEMEYCPGGSLADRLAASGPFPVRDVVSIGVKIAGVLELARLGGIVHRDVKPANVLLTRFGEPALADFGIAIVSGEITGTTQALTPVHAAPEVLESRGVGPAADQWSLGSTLHTLLAGRAPFATGEDEGLLAGMLRILNDPVPAIPRGDVPETLRSVLARAMAKAPEDRWPGPADLGQALQEVERREGWPVTTLPTEEVPESRYAPSAEPSTGDVGPPGTGLDPRATYALPAEPAGGGPSGPASPPARQGSIWPAPSAPAGPPPAPPEGHTQHWARGAGPRPGAVPVGDEVGPRPGPTPPSGPPPPPAYPPDPSTAESTQYWARRSGTPVEQLPALPDEERSTRKLWAVVAGGVVVLAAIVVAVLVTRSPPRPHIIGRTVTPPSSPTPDAYAPVGLYVAANQGTTVTLRWKDPNNQAYPFVVQVVGMGNPQATSSDTQTVVEGLQPGKGYCFTVGALYSSTFPPAYAKATCTGNAAAVSTTTVATTLPVPTTAKAG